DAVAAELLVLVELAEQVVHLVLAARVREVGRDVVELGRELVPGLLPERVARVLLHRRLHVLPESVVVAVGARDADDCEARRQQAADGERVERRHELLVREVAGGAEDDERAGIRRLPQGEALRERVLLLRGRGGGHSSGLFSRWPPKPLRMAERTRSPKSASPREANLLNSEAASTGVGTPSSTAACTVHRPSPESLTRPAYSSSPGVSCRASAVRSSSHEATTEPRRQSSVIAAMSRSY